MCYLYRCIDPEGGVEEDVIKQMFEERATVGQVDEVLGELEETVENLLRHMLSGRLKPSTQSGQISLSSSTCMEKYGSKMVHLSMLLNRDCEP